MLPCSDGRYPIYCMRVQRQVVLCLRRPLQEFTRTPVRFDDAFLRYCRTSLLFTYTRTQRTPVHSVSWWVILDRPPAVDFDSTMPLWNEAAHDFVPEMRVHVPHASRSVKCAAAECESIIPLDRLVGTMVEACCSMRPGCPCYLLSAVFRHHHYVRRLG